MRFSQTFPSRNVICFCVISSPKMPSVPVWGIWRRMAHVRASLSSVAIFHVRCVRQQDRRLRLHQAAAGVVCTVQLPIESFECISAMSTNIPAISQVQCLWSVRQTPVLWCQSDHGTHAGSTRGDAPPQNLTVPYCP